MGVVFLFYGFRLFKPILAMSGFLSFALLTFVVLLNLEFKGVDIGGNRNIIYVVSCAVAGIVGAGMMIFFWKLGLFFVGGLGGFAFAVFVLSWKDNGLIDEGLIRPVFVIASVISCALLAVYFEKPMIIFLTSITGSVLISAGIDNFAQLGFLAAVQTFITNQGTFVVSMPMYGLLGSMLLLAIAGGFVQSKLTGKSKRFFHSENNK